MFHGGTIFRDAASKVIHVENQVSLGAGETVMSKLRFEEWLWEQAAARVKHYHSDNGVFTAEHFQEACRDGGQTQSFSGVGAKHQNSEAERAIQTIMYMARSFMIHSTLHWSSDGADDLALWSFAVDHAAWIYNRIPQLRSGITPLELLTGIHSDFSDLRRAHVWGCPVFVLDAKLQDGKKLPKWNRRARMGQFLGFSRSHSSLVAMVRNLHTGHVSPQYHVVFDDKFETIFNMGAPEEQFDTLCNDLFENSRDWYTEEEYDGDGNLIYKPPPLDEVWLSEPERRDRRAALDEQRRRQELRERKLASDIPNDSPPARDDSPPGLIVSDDEESDDESSIGDPSPPRASGSEGEKEDRSWHSDHPSLENELESEHFPPRPAEDVPIIEPDSPAVPEAPNIPAEGATAAEGESPPRGRDPDGRSRRLKKKPRPCYNCSLGEKQIPVAVRQASRRKLKYRQRMAKRRFEGDAMLRAQSLSQAISFSSSPRVKVPDDLPSIEDIMNCPLSKFIHFAANDCGYCGSRRDLIVNWVHPLFLKAKSSASKEDNPNWRKAMNGPFKEQN